MAGPSVEGAGGDHREARFAWLALLLGAWIVGGTFLVVRALNLELATDVGLSPYHLVGYLGILALVVLSIGIVVRARRHGRSWREAFPPGYGALGAGLVALIAYIVVDVAWREGVGIGVGIEGSLAPSRIVLVVGLALVALAPLRAAVLATDRSAKAVYRAWPAALSAGLLLSVLAVPGNFHPAINPWLEQPVQGPEDDSEIWVMDADGSHQTRLIEAGNGVEASWAAWSTDGSRIAYARWPSGVIDVSKQDADIWVANADGSGAHVVAAGPGWQWIPRWVPGDEWVSFTNEASGGPWLNTGPQGPEGGFGVQGPAFDAAGAGAARPEADLWRVRADGSGTPEPIAPAPGDDRSGSWSPDGTRVAFDSTRHGNTEIYDMKADGSDPNRLTHEPGEDWAPAWSPDGKRIAFASDRSGSNQVYVMDVDGGDVRQVTTIGIANQGPAWSPDGKRIAFESWQTGEGEVWSMAADGGDQVNLSRSPGTGDWIWDGGWGPDGRLLFSRHGMLPANASQLAREDLGAAAMLIQALVVAAIALVLIRVRPPFGAFAAMQGLATLLLAVGSDQWRFVPAAIVGGLLVDVLVRIAPAHRRAEIAAAGSAVVLVLGSSATVLFTGGIAWSPTLTLGIAAAAGAAGWAMARVFGHSGAGLAPGG